MGYKSDIKFPVVVLKGGTGHSQCVLDLLFPDPPVTFKLVKGNGPIHLLGNHSVGSKYYKAVIIFSFYAMMNHFWVICV